MVLVSSLAFWVGCAFADGAAVVPVQPEVITFKEKGCFRELSFQFKHNDKLPQGDAESCSSGEMFADGLPGSTQERSTEIDLAQTLSSEDAKLLVATAGGPTHLTFDWLTCGHPPDEWKKPHYDLHIFKVSKADRPPICVQPDTYGWPTYVCKEASNPKYFQYGNAGDQVLEGMSSDVSGIVGQGNHWAVRPVRNPEFTEPEIVFMTYDSKVVAYETMLPVTWFSVQSAFRNYTFAYKDFSALPTGWHPVNIQEEVIDANKMIKVSVLYDSFPTRCSVSKTPMASLLTAKDTNSNKKDTNAEESNSVVVLPSLFALLSVVVRSFDLL